MIGEVASSVINYPILLREEYDKKSRQCNNLRKMQHAIKNIPYRITEVVRVISEINKEYKWCKLVLMRHDCPLDIFINIKDYLFMPTFNFNPYPRLNNRYGLRIVSKLIQSEYVIDIPMALQIANNYDQTSRLNKINLHQELKPYINLPYEDDIFTIWFM